MVARTDALAPDSNEVADLRGSSDGMVAHVLILPPETHRSPYISVLQFLGRRRGVFLERLKGRTKAETTAKGGMKQGGRGSSPKSKTTI